MNRKYYYPFFFIAICSNELNAENYTVPLSNKDDIECPIESNFKTINLKNVIKRTLCNSPKFKKTWLEYNIKVSQLKILDSDYLPLVSVNSNYNFGKTNNDVKGASFLSYDTSSQNYGLAIQANWLIYDFGYKKLIKSQAKDLIKLSLAQKDVAMQNLILVVIEKYLTILKLESNLNNLKIIEENSNKLYLISEEKYNLGLLNKFDKLTLYNNNLKIKSQRQSLENEIFSQKKSLSVLMGDDYNINYFLDDIDFHKENDFNNIEILFNMAKDNHPALKGQEYIISSIDKELKMIDKENLPKFSLFSNLENYKKIGKIPFGSTTNNIDVGVQLSFPLFDGFKSSNRKIKEQYNKELEIEEKNEMQRAIYLNIIKYYYDIEKAKESIEIFNKLEASSSEAYIISLERYKIGVGNILDLISSQNSLLDTLNEKNNLNYSYLLSRYNLLSNIGSLNISDF